MNNRMLSRCTCTYPPTTRLLPPIKDLTLYITILVRSHIRKPTTVPPSTTDPRT